MAEAFLDFIWIGKRNQVKELVAMNSTKEDPSFRTGNSRTYPGDVTNSELAAMKLSAKLCKKNNSIILNEMLQDQDGDMESGNLQLLKLNASFMIKSENSHFYTRGILTRRPLEHTPSTLCPDSAKHSALIEHLPLSAACPTCWSVQRLGYIKPNKPKPGKRCSPTQQLPKHIPSCKMKITGPAAKKSETAAVQKEVNIKLESLPEKDKKETTAKETDKRRNDTQKRKEDGFGLATHSMETRARPKTGKSKIKTSKSNETKPSKSGNIKSNEKKTIEVKTRTRTIIPVKFTSL